MTFLSLFTGIGGLDLGLERAGWQCVGQVETNPYCQGILAKHWPKVWRWSDVRLLDGDTVRAHCGAVKAIVGGFPCQDISSAATATKRLGLAGRRSGLWREFLRIITESRTSWVLVENSPRWQSWVPAVRADLARVGYASLPLVLSAAAVGAPHARSRAFVVAHADVDGESLRAVDAEVARVSALAGAVPWPDQRIGLEVDDGLSRGLALRALGQAVVPRVAEMIGKAILSVGDAA